MLLCAWMQSANHPSHAVPVLDDGGNITGYESDFVFVSGRGEPITRDTFQKRLKRAVERYNRFIDPGMKYFNPHTTRHIFTCIMYERTHDIKLVSAMLGHASTSTTMDIYNHLSNKQEETMRSVIDEINEEEDRERGRSQE